MGSINVSDPYSNQKSHLIIVENSKLITLNDRKLRELQLCKFWLLSISKNS